MIADVVFDLPRDGAFAYAVPAGMTLVPGQRVAAPLGSRRATGVVVGVRSGDPAGLKPLHRVVDPVPLLGPTALEVTRWASLESLSSWGSTLLAMLPPPATGAGAPGAPPPAPSAGPAPVPELWVGAEREARLRERLENGRPSALVIAPDRESVARWARELDAARLDSDMPAADRRAAWLAAARGRTPTVVGTRSALLVPLPPPATLALLDEADAAHKPPGHPRLHSREILVRRAQAESSSLLVLAAAPSVETWHRALVEGWLVRSQGGAGWPEVIAADTRGVLRNHPLTLPLTRAIDEMTRAGRRVALLVDRRPSSLGCAECGALLRCPVCGLPLGLSAARRALGCALCGHATPLPDRCPACGGHRLVQLGWDAERVEASVRRRFPRLRVSRSDAEAQVAIGGLPLLRRLDRARLGAVGVVAIDGLLGAPDFRAGERAFALLWAAAESAGPGGRLIVQTRHPDHEAIRAVARRDRDGFYRRELASREQLGYPPYRRLCRITTRGRGAAAEALALACARALSVIPGVVAYPPSLVSPGEAAVSRWRLLAKGPPTLPRLLSAPLGDLLARGRGRGGMVEIEMDPVF